MAHAVGRDPLRLARGLRRSQAAPFRSIARAARAAVPSTTVLVAPGDYPGGLATTANGAEGKRIVFLSQTRWGARLGSGSGQTGWWSKGSHVDVIGFEVTGAGAKTWRVGIYATGARSSIQYCKVHDILRDPTEFAAAESSHNGGAGAMGDNWYGNEGIDLIGNLIHAVGPAGRKSSLVHGIYQTAPGRVANNVVHDTVGVGITLWHDAHDIVIVNNTIFDARDGGIFVGAGDAGIRGGAITARAGDYVTVASNIVVGSTWGISEGGRTGTHNRYLNNLVFDNPGGGIRLRNGLVATRTVAADPRFVDVAARNFRLLAGSPAIDAAAAPLAPPRDFDLGGRPAGAAPDIGAFERP